jgi:sRNA-binding protein
MNHRATRDENENVVRMLCENYPKCFFENPRHRQPLKKDIAIDLIKDENFNVAPEMIHAAVDWYKSHVGYQIASSTAGTKRIDLDGKEVGTITEPEAIAAQQEVARINKSIEQRNSPVSKPIEVVHKMYASGKITDDGLKKLDAPPRSSRRQSRQSLSSCMKPSATPARPSSTSMTLRCGWRSPRRRSPK